MVESSLFGVTLDASLGGHATVLFAALAGSLWPLSTREAGGRMGGAMFVLRLVLTSFVLTSLVSSLVESQIGWKVGVSSSPVAFMIAAMGDAWKPIFQKFADRISALLGSKKDDEK